MSIEWSLYEVRPVGRQRLVQATDRMANRLTGGSILDFTMSLASASRADDSATFTSQVHVTCDGLPALVDIEAGPAIEDSRELVERSDLLGTVSSRRSLLSVALGLIVAIAWLEQGGGELSGTGLGSAFVEADVESRVVRFSAGQGNGKDGIEHLARRIVGDDARMNFA